MHVNARVRAKCGLSEQEHARRAYAFSIAALFLMRTWSIEALVWVIGLGVAMFPRSRLCVQSFGLVIDVCGDIELTDGED